jgi:hypothetical protein
MFRFLLYLALGYVIWLVIRSVARTFDLGSRPPSGGSVHDNGTRRNRTRRDQPEIRDADFEDIQEQKKAE